MHKPCYGLRGYLLPFLLFTLIVMLIACNTVSDKLIIKNSTRTPIAPIPTVTLKPFPQAARIDAYLTKLAAEGTLGGSVLVEHNGMLFEKGYGVADFAYNGFYSNKNLDVVVLSNLETTDVWQIGRTLASMV